MQGFLNGRKQQLTIKRLSKKSADALGTALVRNFVPSHQVVVDGGWNIADCVQRSYDVEGMDVGVIAAGRIGRAVLERMKPFGVNLHYFDVHRLSPELEQQLGVTFHPTVESLARSVDVVSIHCPLIAQTHHMFNEKLLGSMRRGSYIVNTARAEETDQRAIVAALESGQLAGYAGDVWYPQPPPADHPWRTMPNNAMTPHISGSSLTAQARYAAGTREILEDWFAGRPIRSEYLIVEGGKFAGTGAKSYAQ